MTLYHFDYSFFEFGMKGDFFDIMFNANGTSGSPFVALFFMLSGGALLYNWEDRLTTVRGKGGVLDFYKKRWLSIFPIFYVAWFIMYMVNVISFGWLFNWGGPYRKLWLTFFGIDGYFMYRGLNYYTVGEWFLGAIVMLYLLYPLLQWCLKKIPKITTVILVLLFAFNVVRRGIPFLAPYNQWVIISDNIHMFTCILPFWTGMLFIKAGRKIINRVSFIVSLAAAIVLNFVPIPFIGVMMDTYLLSVCYYFIFSGISVWIDGRREKREPKVYDAVIGFFSKYSFAFFLVHHVIIQKIMSNLAGHEFNFIGSILLFFPILGVISVAAVILKKVTDLILSFLTFIFGRIRKQDA